MKALETKHNYLESHWDLFTFQPLKATQSKRSHLLLFLPFLRTHQLRLIWKNLPIVWSVQETWTDWDHDFFSFSLLLKLPFSDWVCSSLNASTDILGDKRDLMENSTPFSPSTIFFLIGMTMLKCKSFDIPTDTEHRVSRTEGWEKEIET